MTTKFLWDFKATWFSDKVRYTCSVL